MMFYNVLVDGRVVGGDCIFSSQTFVKKGAWRSQRPLGRPLGLKCSNNFACSCKNWVKIYSLLRSATFSLALCAKWVKIPPSLWTATFFRALRQNRSYGNQNLTQKVSDNLPLVSKKVVALCQ